ncbi:unnamed protein product, partial [Staurois parvus]
YTWHSQASTVLLATAKPRHVQQIARQRSVIHYSREHISTAVESSGNAELLLFPVASTLLITPLTVNRGIFSSREI